MKYYCLFLVVVCIAFSSCMQKYYDRNGKVFKAPNDIVDNATVPKDTIDKYSFSASAYLKGVNDGERIKYLTPVKLKELLSQTDKLLVIFYNPVCACTAKESEVINLAKELGLLFLLVSCVNEPKAVVEWNKKFNIDNVYSCILPSVKKNTEGRISKPVNLIASICDSCVQKYRDELIYCDYFISTNHGQSIHLDIEQRNYSRESVLSWIKDVANTSPKH